MEKNEILKLNVLKLREAAHKVPNLAGISGMNKEQLVHALFEHYGYPLEEAVHIVKDPAVKANIRKLKKERDEALTTGDGVKASRLQRKVHALKRTTRRWTKAQVRARVKTHK